jgi:AcrR family transcriptional regulator
MRKFSEADTSVRRAAVVEAATQVFLRYGYAKTTMADIADASKLSRPALYLVFPSKEEIFDAVVHRLSEESLERYRAELPKFGNLDRALHHFCADWGSHGFELMERHPDAKDLFDLKFPAVRQMYEDFIVFLTKIIGGAVAESILKATAGDLVRVLVYSFRGLKETARDAAHLRRLIRLQVEILLTALAAQPAKSSESPRRQPGKGR